MATQFPDLIRKSRPLRARRADMVIVPREMEIERQFIARRHGGTRFWHHPDVREFAASFAIFFTGAMVFLA
jgi:hypothetical protein